MKLALVNDWLMSGVGGSEKVLQAICEIFNPPLFTLVSDPKNLQDTFFEKVEIHNSFVQKLPFSKKKYRNYLPFFPMAIEQFNLSTYDVVLSCSHSVAKGVLTNSEQLHICYCYTPIRYAWDLYYQYLRESKLERGLKAKLAKFFLHYVRMWDIQSASRVDEYVAISHFIAKRIQKIYGKTASVIYPPVNTEYFSFCSKKENYYVTASRFVPYKKIDMIVEAFTKMPHLKLIVIGDGPDRKKIERKAGKNVELLGQLSDLELKQYLQKARAFVFAAIEDFGILPLEAQSCGTPVIALKKGGVKETVVENVTGIFFEEQNIESLIQAVHKFEKKQDIFDLNKIREHAKGFCVDRFKREMEEFVLQKYFEFST